jgi:hypothetical protein
MYVIDLIDKVRNSGIELAVKGNKLRFHPQSAVTPEMLKTLIQYKQQILVYLMKEHGEPITLYSNPPICHNPYTPHSTHSSSQECEPNSCHCYRIFGYPRLCQGVPCRWVWPSSSISGKS